VVYEGLPFEHRRSVHREIGGYIEEISAENLGEQTNLLAYHFYEGQAWEKAMGYNLTAAQHAQREFANDIAILSGQRALESADKLGPEVDTSQVRVAAHETLGEVMTLVGQYDEALENYGLARELVEGEELSEDHLLHMAELSRKTAEVFERRSEYEVAFEWMDQGLSYVDDGEPTIEAVRIYILQAGVYFRQGKLDEAIAWCQKTLEIASLIDTREGQQVVAQAYYNLGHIHTRRGDMAQSVKFCNDSIRIYKEIDDVLGQARAYNNLAIAYTDQGDWENASDALSNSLEINQRIGNIQEQGFIANNLANIHLYRGEWDQAENLYKQSNEIWKQVGAKLPEAVVLSNLAQVNIYQGNVSEAADALKQSQEIFTELGSEDFLAELERRWGEYYLKSGDLDQALQHTKHSIEIASAQEGRLDQGISLRILGEVYQARREFEDAEKYLKHSLRILTDLDSEYEAAKTMLSLAYLAFEREETSEKNLLDQAIDTLKRLGAQADLERAVDLKKQFGN
jgi:tetratricopeptide (TPR) repeat protein